MDYSKLVTKKLLPADRCVSVLQGSYLDSGERCPGLLSLVENKDGHCVFLYTSTKASPGNPNDLELFKVMEVDCDLKCKVDSPYSRLILTNSKHSMIFEAIGQVEVEFFLLDLEHAKQVYSQNAVFATPSFDWMYGYLFPTEQPPKPQQPQLQQQQQQQLPQKQQQQQQQQQPQSRKISLQADSLIRFEDTTLGQEEEDGVDGWPFSQIIKPHSGRPCPVVVDNTTTAIPGGGGGQATNSNHSNSTGRGGGKMVAANNIEAVHRSNSRDKLRTAGEPSRNYSSLGRTREVRGSPGAVDPLNQLNSTSLSNRENIIALMLKERQADFTSKSNYRIFCGTWNVNGQSPTVGLHDWLASESERESPPDIYAIGLQEMDLSKNLYIMGESAREAEWLVRIEEALAAVGGSRYIKVHSVRLIAIMLVIYVKETITYLSEVMVESAPTGFFGVVGNKGGVAVRMRLQDTTLCFVNSHLCAHTEEWMRRNQDYKDINSKLIFRNSINNKYHTISDHDMIFWFGDLNYRISDIEADDCKLFIDNDKLPELLDFDQLVRQMSMKRVFPDFKEGPLKFKPTYKFDPGTDNWDTEKVRTPSWCDRVLWKGTDIKQVSYKSHPRLKISDHKPVSGVFVAGIKVVNVEKERAVREQINKMIDMRENEFLPKATLDVREVIFFTDLKYLDTQQKSVVLTNTGKVLVNFQFVCKDDDPLPFKPWLHVEPSEGLLYPGDKVTIELEVQINSKTVRDWQKCQIEDNLVLQLQGGQSIFLPISGTRKPSSFGLPLTTLATAFGPVAECLDDNFKLKQLPSQSERPLDIPKELWFLVDYLFKFGMGQPDLFHILGIEEEIRQIRDALDTSRRGLDGLGGNLQIHSVAETLLIFLDSLPDPVVPYACYDRCLDASTLKESNEILEAVPSCHRNVFKYVCAFLAEFVGRSNKTTSDVRVLSHIFGAVLLKRDEGNNNNNDDNNHKDIGHSSLTMSTEENNKKATFVYRFITGTD